MASTPKFHRMALEIVNRYIRPRGGQVLFDIATAGHAKLTIKLGDRSWHMHVSSSPKNQDNALRDIERQITRDLKRLP